MNTKWNRLLSLLLSIMLLACTAPFIKVAQAANSETLFTNLPSWTQKELQVMLDSGFVTQELASRYAESVTGAEFLALLEHTKEILGMGNDLYGLTKEELASPITRRTAVMWLQDMFYDSLFTVEGLMGPCYQYDAATKEMADAGKKDGDGDEPYYPYVLDYRDITTNYSIMEMETDYRFRPDDEMTVLEAMQAAFRASNSKIPEDDLVTFQNADAYQPSQDIIEAARAFAPATAEDLPAFHGIVTRNKSDVECGAEIGIMYTDNQAELFHELGFDFTRVPLAYDLFLSQDGTKINQMHVKDLDSYIEACIRNQLHVCLDLHYWPADGSYNVDAMKQFWAFLAARYRGISSNALSFNVINEPSGSNEELDAMNIALLNAVHEIDEDRLVFCDGYCDGGVAKLPSALVAKENAAQSVHWYSNPFNGDTVHAQGGYPAQDIWPFPFVNNYVDEDSPIVLSGAFTQGEALKLRVVYHGNDEQKVQIALDASPILDTSLAQGTLVDGSEQMRTFLIEIPNDGNEITISSDGIHLYNIEIEHTETTNENLEYFAPYYYGTYSGIGNNHLITNIICTYADFYPVEQHITIAPDGTYSSDTAQRVQGHIPLWQTDYGKAGILDFLSVWENYKSTTGKAYMMQEMGIYCSNVPMGVRAHYISELLSALQELKVGWCTYDASELMFSPRYYYRKDATWINVNGFWICKDLLDCYTPYL